MNKKVINKYAENEIWILDFIKSTYFLCTLGGFLGVICPCKDFSHGKNCECGCGFISSQTSLIEIIFHSYYDQQLERLLSQLMLSLPEQMHFLTMSQSVPQDECSIFCWSRMSFSCCRTSRTFLIALAWMKCSLHQEAEYLQRIMSMGIKFEIREILTGEIPAML